MESIFKIAYAVSLVVFGFLSAFFQIMDFQTTIIGMRDCVDCESNPYVVELYEDGGAQSVYNHTLHNVEVVLARALCGLAMFIFAEFLPSSDRLKFLLYGVSFAIFAYLVVSVFYHALPVYNNLWALYYVGAVGG